MNVKELKEFIKDIPDDVELCHNEIDDCNYELTILYHERLDQLEFYTVKRDNMK